MRRYLPFLIIPAILFAGFVGFRYYQAQQAAAAAMNFQLARAERGKLVANVGATGVVRANQTAVLVWQTTGSVGAVPVQVGDLVVEGTELASLKQNSLPQNIILAQSELVSARKALEDLVESQMPAAQALQAVQEAEDALAEYESNLQLRRAQAQIALVNAQEAFKEAERKLKNMDYPRASSETIDEAYARYVLAQEEYERAESVYNSLGHLAEDDPARAAARAALAEANRARNSALGAYNWYTGDRSDTEISEAEANYAQAQANLDKAQLEWDRIKDGGNPAELALLKAQLADAQREYENYKNGAPQNEVDAIEAQIAAAEAALEMAHLVAPFDGTVTVVSIKPGDQVSPGSAGIRIDDLSHLFIDVSVSEVDINRIQTGQPVTLTFDAIQGKEYEGFVTEVAVVGTDIQGVVEFTVTVELTDADEDVKPGMTAGVNIVVEELQDVLLVPNRAVRVVDGKRVVYVLKNGSMQRVEVELGATSESVSEVIDGGLKEGDQIILNPPTMIESGGPRFMR